MTNENLFVLTVLAFSVPAFAFMVVGTALHFVGTPILRRRRTRPIRGREYPAWEHWLAKRYPKATKDEAGVIRRVIEAVARDAGVEPTQLLPEDRLSGHVLPSPWEYFIGTDGESDLSLEMEDLLREREIDPADWARAVDEPCETVGEAIDFMLERLCPRTNEPVKAPAK